MNEKEKALDDLKIIRSMMDRTKEAIDPAAPILILWGIIVFLGNVTTHFLVSDKNLHVYIGYTWWALATVGIIVSAIMGYKIGLRRYKYGINYYASRQLALIWTILVPIGIIWSILGPRTGVFPYEGMSVFWALLYCIGIYVMGIFYSREFIIGGIAIFIGTILSVIFGEYHSIIVGVFMGSGTAIPAIVAHRRFKKTVGQTNER